MLKTIKGKLILSLCSVCMLVTLILSLYFFIGNYQAQEKDLVQMSSANLEYFESNVNKLLERCSLLSDKIYFNRNIGKILLRDYYSSPKQNLDRDLSEGIRDIADYLSNDIISSYVTGIIIKGNNGQTIKYGIDADYYDIEELEREEWFIANRSNSEVKWLPIIENTSEKTVSRYYIPLVRRCISTDGRKEIGWQFITVTTDLIRDAIQDYNFREDEILIVYDSNNVCVYSNKEYVGQEELNLILENYDEEKLLHYDEQKWYALKNVSEYTGLTFMHLVNYRYFENEIKTLYRSSFLAIFLTVSMAVIMTIFLSNMLTRPIQRIMNKLELISQGDFSVDESLNGDDEIGNIGRGINNLVQNVEVLMGRVREEERQKKEYEYKILQSQINPHFVYNVLNSIRIMANLQGADNISNVTENFGGLLKEVSKGVDDKVTVTEEFKLTEKYVYLQKLRRKGLLQYESETELGCEQNLVLKFMLQPLIENSILHGLEKKKGVGRIQVRAFRRDDRLLITIWDNGDGMTEQEIDNLMNARKQPSIGQYNKVGVRNVQERIQLIYGPEYGLHYESNKGEFTKVTVVLPCEQGTERREEDVPGSNN